MTDDGERRAVESDGDDPGMERRLTCVVCGAAIDPTEWHPVRTRIDAAGDLRIDAFCSEECRERDEE